MFFIFRDHINKVTNRQKKSPDHSYFEKFKLDFFVFRQKKHKIIISQNHILHVYLSHWNRVGISPRNVKNINNQLFFWWLNIGDKYLDKNNHHRQHSSKHFNGLLHGRMERHLRKVSLKLVTGSLYFSINCHLFNFHIYDDLKYYMYIKTKKLYCHVAQIFNILYTTNNPKIFSRKMPMYLPSIGGVLGNIVYILFVSFESMDVSWLCLASFLTGIFGGVTR